MAIDIRRLTRLTLGINTENGVEEYRFDTSPWRKEHPGLHTFQLNVTPPGGMPYRAETHMEGDVLVWPITENDTALPGDNGLYEIEAFGDAGLHKLSPTKPLVVYARMVGDIGDAPTSIQSWVETANSVLEDNRTATSNAQKAAEDAQTAAEDAQTAAAAAEAAAQGAVVRNLLDNSNFSIWQRGNNIENAIVADYGADRWRGSGNLLRTYTKITYGCRITAKTSGTYMGIQQQVPVTGLETGTYTLMWSFTPSASCKTYQGATVSAGVQKTELLLVTITAEHLSAGYYSAELGVMCLADNSPIPVDFYFDVHYTALYEGAYTAETLPSYQPKGYAAELAECMRYYQRIDGAKFSFYSSSGTERYFFGSCNFPMIMRKKPTITISTAKVSGVGTASNATPYNWNERGVYQIAVQTETTPDTHDWCSFVAECSADL